MDRLTRPQYINFITGGAASITAEISTLPLDTLKVRLQQQSSGKTLKTCFRNLWQQEGIRGFYRGLIPGIYRQGIYSSIKMSIYGPIRDKIAEGKPSIHSRIIAGGLAGGIGSIFSNPFDIIKIRMQSAQEITRCFTEFCRLGLKGLHRGILPNVQRSFVVNAAELATYDTCKNFIIDSSLMNDHIGTHFCSSVIAGFFAAGASAPIDFTKTKLMNNDNQYRGIVDCMSKTIRSEGFLALYRGFIPSWMRIGPWCCIMFISWEQYRKLLQSYKPINEH